MADFVLDGDRINVLFVGDVVGRAGRQALTRILPSLRASKNAGLTVVNGENSAGGFGISIKTHRELREAGAQVITGGNHSFQQADINSTYQSDRLLLRPHNYPDSKPGKGFCILEASGKQVAIVNLIGNVFVGDGLPSPFGTMEKLLASELKDVDVVFVDFHAEATSEKQAFARCFDGRVGGVFGTHTHVQTADESILPQGTAFIADLGMTGPTESIIGMQVEPVVARFSKGARTRFEAATGPSVVQGVSLVYDLTEKRCISIERVSEKATK